MNSRFHAHLWMEWREHRAAALGLIVASALGSVLMAWLGTRNGVPMIDAPAFALAAAAALAIFSLGSEIVGRELSGESRAAIARLPGSLNVPFLVRLAVFVVMVAACGIVAWSSMRSAVAWFGGRSIADAPLVRYPLVVLLVAIAGTWTLAASCWLKKSALAAPAAAALLAIFIVAPLSFQIHGRPIFAHLRGELAPIASLAAFSGVLAAWISFTRGLRHGGGRAAAFLGGATSLVLLTLPIPALGGYRTYDWLHLDPHEPGFRIESAFVGETGRFAFVTAWQESESESRHSDSRYAFVVDLGSGEYQALGVDRSFDTLDVSHDPDKRLPAPPRANPQPFVRCLAWDQLEGSVIFDGRSGTIVGDEDAVRANPETNARLAAITEDATASRKWDAKSWRGAREDDRFVAFEGKEGALVLEGGEARKTSDRAKRFPLVRIEKTSGKRTRIGDGSFATAIFENHTIFALDPELRTLVRVRLDGSPPEIVFPRLDE